MRVKAEVTIRVWYDDAKSEQQVRDMLDSKVFSAVGNGLLEDGSEAVSVDTWDHSITVVKSGATL